MCCQFGNWHVCKNVADPVFLWRHRWFGVCSWWAHVWTGLSDCWWWCWSARICLSRDWHDFTRYSMHVCFFSDASSISTDVYLRQLRPIRQEKIFSFIIYYDNFALWGNAIKDKTNSQVWRSSKFSFCNPTSLNFTGVLEIFLSMLLFYQAQNIILFWYCLTMFSLKTQVHVMVKFP